MCLNAPCTSSVLASCRCIGKLRCDTVTLQIGEHSSVTFRVASFPEGPATLGDRLRDTEGGGTPFRGLLPVRVGVSSVNVAHVGPLPTLLVSQGTLGAGTVFMGSPALYVVMGKPM